LVVEPSYSSDSCYYSTLVVSGEVWHVLTACDREGRLDGRAVAIGSFHHAPGASTWAARRGARAGRM